MIKPLPGYVLVEPIEDEQKSAGGVYLPESSKDKPSKGKIINIGKPETGDQMEVKTIENYHDYHVCSLNKNDVVIFKKWTNQEVEDKGKKYLLVKFDELLGIVE